MARKSFSEIAELVHRVKEKDSAAFTDLYEATYQQLYYYILSLVHRETDAEDILQDVYILVLQKLDTLQDDKLFIAWVNHIAFNRCMRFLSEQKGKSTGELYEDEMLALPDTEPENDPLLSSVKSDSRRRVLRALEKLPAASKTVLIMQFYNNMKMSEIAVVLGCPVGTVKSRLNTARQQLKKALSGQEGMLSMIVGLALASALRQSATGVALAPEAALSSLLASLEKVGMSTQVSFTPVATAVPAGPSPVQNVATGAAAGVTVAAVAVGAMQLTAAPDIRQISYENSNVVASTMVTVDVAGTVKPDGVVFVTPAGDTLVAESCGNGKYSFTAAESGLYTIKVTGNNGKTDTESITITNIDSNGPKVLDYSIQGDRLQLTVSDDMSSINYANVYATAGGETVLPESVDEAAGVIYFSLGKGDLDLYLEDSLGNFSTYHIAVLS